MNKNETPAPEQTFESMLREAAKHAKGTIPQETADKINNFFHEVMGTVSGVAAAGNKTVEAGLVASAEQVVAKKKGEGFFDWVRSAAQKVWYWIKWLATKFWQAIAWVTKLIAYVILFPLRVIYEAITSQSKDAAAQQAAAKTDAMVNKAAENLLVEKVKAVANAGVAPAVA
jgi:hypothetical protein